MGNAQPAAERRPLLWAPVGPLAAVQPQRPLYMAALVQPRSKHWLLEWIEARRAEERERTDVFARVHPASIRSTIRYDDEIA